MAKSKLLWMLIIAALFAWTSLRRQYQDAAKRKKEQQEIQAKVEAKPTPTVEEKEPFPVETTQKSEEEKQETTAIDAAVLESELKNFGVDDDTLLANYLGREAELIPKLQEIVSKTTYCLKQDLCGEKPDPKDPYFNPEETPGHMLLGRSLLFLNRFREQGILQPGMIPNHELDEIFGIQNKDIQIMALELRVANGVDEVGYNDLLHRTGSLKPEAAATTLALLNQASQESQQRRDKLIETAERLMSPEDQLRVIEISKRIKNINPTQRELERFAKQSCSLLPQNRKVFEQNLQIAGEGVGANIQFICE